MPFYHSPELRPWPWERLAVHRAGGILAPENTMSAFREGLRQGYRAIETDAMLASDGIPVLMHDEVFGRTVNSPGSVPDYTSEQIRTMDAGSWFSPFYAGEPPAGFLQAMHWCRKNGVWANIEIKPAKGHERDTGRVVGALTAELFSDVLHNVMLEPDDRQKALPLFSSFTPEALLGAKETTPIIPRGYLVDDLPHNWLEVMDKVQAVSLHINHKKLTPEMVRIIKDAGYWVFCWTVNSPERARELFSWGVDAMCTDRPDLIRPGI